jgi:uncharacterized protein involved in exopolysaccharide biosynthesis
MAQGVIDRTGAEGMLLTGSQGFDEEESIDLVELFQALLRRKWTILALSLGCFVLAMLIAFLLPLQYTSTASFIPPNVSAGGSMATALAGQLSAIGAGDMLGTAKSSGELYSGMLKSRTVLGDLVKHFDLMQLYGLKKESQAEETLAGKTVISVDVKSTIVTLSVTDKSPILQMLTWMRCARRRADWRSGSLLSAGFSLANNWPRRRTIWKTPRSS